MKKSEKGFSIMELLAGFAVLGIAFAVSLPNLKDIQQHRALGQTVTTLEQSLQQQALMAITMERERAVHFDLQNGKVSASFADEKEPLRIDTLLSVPKNIKLAEAKFASFDQQPHVLVFRPNATATPGRVTLRENQAPQNPIQERSCSLVQGLRGLPRLECTKLS